MGGKNRPRGSVIHRLVMQETGLPDRDFPGACPGLWTVGDVACGGGIGRCDWKELEKTGGLRAGVPLPAEVCWDDF